MFGIEFQGAERKALLIECPHPDLRAVETDVRFMKKILTGYGFACEKLHKATRAGIFAAWRKLIEQISQGDAVVIFYSGHGGVAERKGKRDDGTNYRRLKYLLPYDFDSDAGGWNGIADVELSQLLHETTGKTKNVTLILDCCLSARLARLPTTSGKVAKSLNLSDYSTVAEHIERAQREGRLTGDFHYERNPDLITIVASADTEKAWEQSFDGCPMGVLTEALDQVMRKGNPGFGSAQLAQVSWRSIMQRVRHHTKITCPDQFPHIEGDDLRIAFTLDKADVYSGIPCSFDADESEVILEAGKVYGIEKGDIFSLLPLEEERLLPSKEITKAIISSVGPSQSTAALQGRSPTDEQWKNGIRAFLWKTTRLFPVRIEGMARNHDLYARINDSKLLTSEDEKAPLATVKQTTTGCQIFEHQGRDSFCLCDWSLEDIAKDSFARSCCDKLQSLARSRNLQTLAPAGGQESAGLISSIEIEPGEVRDGKPEPWLDPAPTVSEDARFYLKVRNRSLTALFVSIFDICAGGVTLVSKAGSTGHRLLPHETYIFGYEDRTGRLKGQRLSWPPDTPLNDGGLLETVVVIVSDCEVDLRGLETVSQTARGPEDDSIYSELCDLLDGQDARNSRTLERDREAPSKIELSCFSFKLLAKNDRH